MSAALVECLYAKASDALTTGARLVDLSVDLSSAFAQDCPPISYYRVVIREPVWLRKIAVTAGGRCDVGSVIAVFSTVPDEPDDGVATRPVRIATAAIFHHAGMWSGREV